MYRLSNYPKRRATTCSTGMQLQSHRMVEVEGTSEGYLVQPPCSSWTTYSRLPKTMTRWLLNISKEDSTASLGNLF